MANSASALAQLLGLPAGVTQPNAYQIFGLKPGESNAPVIRAAIASKIASLKQAKSDTDPALWAKAAKIVQTAQRVLSDPEQKAELDARFGIVVSDPVPTKSSATSSSMAADPLAGLLPGHGSPTQDLSEPSRQTASQPTQEPSDLSSSSTPAPGTTLPPPPSLNDVQRVADGRIAGESQMGEPEVSRDSPTIANPESFPPGSIGPASAGPIVRRRVTRRRRSWAGFVFGSFVVICLASVVGVLGYFAILGPGELRIVRGDGQVAIQTGPKSESSPIASDPAPLVAKSPPSTMPPPKPDPILPQPEPIQRGPSDRSLSNVDSSATSGNAVAEPASTPTSPTMTSGPAMPPDPAMAFSAPTTSGPAMTSNPAMMSPPAAASPNEAPPIATPTPPAPSPEAIAKGEQAIAVAKQSLESADWQSMVAACEQARADAIGDDQTTMAQAMFDVADLAVFFREGISRAMASLKAGNEFKLTPTLDVIVVSASASQIEVRRGEKIRAYTLDSIPLIVADSLALMQVDLNSATGQAARFAYQAISPKGTPEHRQESIKELMQLTGLEGVDTAAMAQLLATLKTE